MDKIIHLQIWQMILAYIFVIILLVIVKIKGIKREKEILISCLRMTLQLVIAGYILVYIFDNSNPFFTFGIILIMVLFAIYNVHKRIKIKLSKQMSKIVTLSLFIGPISSLLFFVLVIVHISPWYNPRYFIPISGMLIGNSMTATTLGVRSMINGMTTQRNMVETALMLGATPKTASKSIIDHTFDSAILPTINTMVGMGIVSLPGMMTGQILSGTSPLTAIEYQIAIMLGILGSVSLTIIILVQLGYKTFFNKRDQLID